MRSILISGGGSAIAQALIERLLLQPTQVYVLSRQPCPLRWHRLQHLHWLQLDLLEQAPQLTSWLAQQQTLPEWVIHCQGVLQDEHITPEKCLQDVAEQSLQHALNINLYTAIALCQQLQVLMPRQHPLRMLLLSAKVGSITDNRSGGWYSYRISKAALNMFVKTLSIEWQRRFPQALLAAVHPGTTDTPLSAPYQERIAKDKLYSPALTASRLLHILHQMHPKQHGALLNWDGQPLPW